MILSIFEPRDRARCRRARVYLDGREVTHDCQVAIVDEPDEAGAVLLLERDAAGRAQLDAAGELARAWYHGAVRLELDAINN